MAHNTEETAPPDCLDSAVGQRVGPCDNSDRRGDAGSLDGEGSGFGESGGAAGGLSGELDSGEADEAAICGEEGHGEAPEAPVSQPDPFVEALGGAKQKLKVGHAVSTERLEENLQLFHAIRSAIIPPRALTLLSPNSRHYSDYEERATRIHVKPSAET